MIWPSANRKPFIVIVTVRSPWAKTGGLASESDGTNLADPASPNQ